MTPRDRIRAAVDFEQPDRLPCTESFWEGTIEAWREEGMPADVAAEDYFGLDTCSMSLDASPRCEQRIVDRSQGHITFEDRFGYTARRLEKESGTVHFLNHVNSGRDAWQRIKPQFSLAEDANEPARIDDASYFMHFGAYPSWSEAVEKYRRVRAGDRYLLFYVYGPWEQMWRHRGMENLFVDVASDPDWVHEMAVTYQDLVLAILRRCLELGMKPDGVFAVDDLGSNRGTLMSPVAWRRIFKPQVARLGGFLHEHGIDFWMHSCGNVQAILDDLVECGLQVLDPLQVAAGMDAAAIRQRYGRRLALHGNLSVAGLLGPQSELESELCRKVPLACQGGYIFHSDHSVPPQVRFERYRWAVERAREIFSGSVAGCRVWPPNS